jgi:hypothetical protein
VPTGSKDAKDNRTNSWWTACGCLSIDSPKNFSRKPTRSHSECSVTLPKAAETVDQDNKKEVFSLNVEVKTKDEEKLPS